MPKDYKKYSREHRKELMKKTKSQLITIIFKNLKLFDKVSENVSGLEKSVVKINDSLDKIDSRINKLEIKVKEGK